MKWIKSALAALVATASLGLIGLSCSAADDGPGAPAARDDTGEAQEALCRCPRGESCCAGGCTTLGSDVNDCGACGNVCPTPENATAACTGGVCGFVCASGFGDCDGNPSNGCEAALDTVENCGGCGNQCPTVGGVCHDIGHGGFRCACTSLDDVICDGQCVDLTTDSDNCGACGAACGAGLVCNGGGCCPSGQGFCDGVCTGLGNDANCASCGDDCSGTEYATLCIPGCGSGPFCGVSGSTYACQCAPPCQK
jgi:hypothetical protein